MMKNVSYFLILFILCSCGSRQSRKEQNSHKDSLANAYNKRGVQLEFHPESKDSLQLALDYFDKALQIDSTNGYFIGNKISALFELRQFDEALKLHTKIYKLAPAPNSMLQGMLTEKVYGYEKAKPYYEESALFYTEMLDTTLNVDIKLNAGISKIASLLLLKRKQAAINLYDSLKNEFPNNQTWNLFPVINQNYSRKKLLDNFFQNNK